MAKRAENHHKIHTLLDDVPLHFALNLEQFHFNDTKMSQRQYEERIELLIKGNCYQVKFDVSLKSFSRFVNLSLTYRDYFNNA